MGIEKIKFTQFQAKIVLFFATCTWGVSFIIIDYLAKLGCTVGQINFLRGFFFFIAAAIFFGKDIFPINKKAVLSGAVAGIFNMAALMFQTKAAMYTSPSNNAFLTATCVIFVPIICFFVYKTKLKFKNYLAIAVAIIGMAILTGIYQTGLAFNKGDMYAFICALSTAGFIAHLGNNATQYDFRVISIMTGLVHMLGGYIFMVIADNQFFPVLEWSKVLLPIMFLGLIASFLAQTAQIIAQKYTNATSAALIMMLEGVIAAIISVALGIEPATVNLVIGGFLILSAIFITEINFSKGRKLHG